MKIIIYQNHRKRETEVIVIKEGLNRDIVYNLYTGISQELKPGEEIPEEFTMKIPQQIVGPFFKAFAEELDKQGIKTEMDAKIEGKLEATVYHLEDLRQLLKLKQ